MFDANQIWYMHTANVILNYSDQSKTVQLQLHLRYGQNSQGQLSYMVDFDNGFITI